MRRCKYANYKAINQVIKQITRLNLVEAGGPYLVGCSSAETCFSIANIHAEINKRIISVSIIMLPKITKIVFEKNTITLPRQQPIPAPCGVHKTLTGKKESDGQIRKTEQKITE